MKNFHVYAIALTALTLSGVPPAAAQQPARRVVLLDRIVAVVNEDVITRRDLDDRLHGRDDPAAPAGHPAAGLPRSSTSRCSSA